MGVKELNPEKFFCSILVGPNPEVSVNTLIVTVQKLSTGALSLSFIFIKQEKIGIPLLHLFCFPSCLTARSLHQLYD